MLLVVVVIVGGFWIRHQLEEAQNQRCALAFGQVRMLQAEMAALEFRILPSEQQLSVTDQFDKALVKVEAACGPLPA